MTKYAIILIIILIVYFFVIRKMKIAKVGSFAMVTGGIKCGKSTYAVALTIKEQKRRNFAVFLYYLFNWGKYIGEIKILKCKYPSSVIYSNIPLSVPYVPITKDLLLRKTRFSYNCVIYINEASLVADSQLIKDKDVNEQLMLFNKLIGHETKGGCIIYDTQQIADVHYSIKRCTSSYFYIHHTYKLPILPLLLVKYRELQYSEDGSVVNVNNSDIEESLKFSIIPRSTWNKFDCYCFSSLTDDLPVDSSETVAITKYNKKALKVKKLFSFRNWRVLNEKENN